MTLKTHIDHIRKGFEKGLFKNKEAICDYIVRRLLDALDWPRYEPNVVIREYKVDGTNVNFALCAPASKPLVFIEVKPFENMEDTPEQLFQYAFRSEVPIVILTDGRKWHFFDSSAQGDYTERKVYEIDLTRRNSEEITACLNRYLNYASILTGEAVRAIKEDYTQKQVEASLAQGWNRLVQEANELLLETIADKTESLCGDRPTEEQVLDFLKSLKKESISDQKKALAWRENQETISSRKCLAVTMPNGEKINHYYAVNSLVEVIEKLGIERVKKLEYKVNGTDLISTSKHHKYQQRQSNHYYIMTHGSTKSKKILLENIASRLGVQLRVEMVDK